MADTPMGLVFHKHVFGLDLPNCTSPYYVASAAIFRNDPVLKAGSANTSNIFNGAEGHIAGTLPDVAVATNGSQISGVMVGKELNASDITIYSQASTADVVQICDDPFVEYIVQEDSDSENLAATAVGNNAEMIFTHSGDSTTGLSGAELDSSSKATTAGHALRIKRLAPSHGNAIGANAKWVVMINDHTELSGIAGV